METWSYTYTPPRGAHITHGVTTVYPSTVTHTGGKCASTHDRPIPWCYYDPDTPCVGPGLPQSSYPSSSWDTCASVTLKATLVWTDYPSETSATVNIVNDLDLVTLFIPETPASSAPSSNSDPTPETMCVI